MRHFTKLAGQSIVLLLVALVLLAFDAPVKAKTTMTDLGTLTGGESYTTANAINENGEIVGQSASQAYIWQRGVMTGLGSLNENWVYSVANGINNRGEVTGQAATQYSVHAFIWRNNVMKDLGTLSGNGDASYGTAISDNGLITGASTLGNGYDYWHAFLWKDSVMTDLGALASYYPRYTTSWATDVNNLGQVVGYSYTSPGNNGPVHAFLWKDGVMTDIGTLLTPGFSQARAINNQGEVTGTFSANDGTHAFLYQDGQMKDLGNLALGVGGTLYEVKDVNANGQLTGSYFAQDGNLHAFLYGKGKFTDFGTLGGNFSVGNAINNRGEVVGNSATADYAQHAFLYRP